MTAPLPIPNTAIPPMVRGACPALATPMMTGDGLLARIGLDGPIRPADLIRIGELAIRHGNGLIDISARGNIQLRGLSAPSARALETDVRLMNLPLRDGVAVETGALAGHDPQEITSPEPLASAIRAFISEYGLSRRLAAKFVVVVDGGGQLPLHALLADIRLLAVRRGTEIFWRILLGGTAGTGRSVGVVADADATTCVTLILARIAAMDVPVRGRALDSAEVREWLGDVVIADDDAVMEQTAVALGLFQLMNAAVSCEARHQPQVTSPPRGEVPERQRGDEGATRQHLHVAISPSSGPSDHLLPDGEKTLASGRITDIPLPDQFAARIGIPFGQCPAETLINLGRQAETAGIAKIRPAIDHSLVFFGTQDACRSMIEFSKDLILSQNDPRAKIAACPGSPACASASIKTHALGTLAARDVANLLDGSFTLHLSGCTKGCAHPAKALVSLVGMNDSTALIFEGKTSDMPLKLIRHGEEGKTLGALAHLVRLERGAGETTRDCLCRLGPARLEKVLSQGLS